MVYEWIMCRDMLVSVFNYYFFIHLEEKKCDAPSICLTQFNLKQNCFWALFLTIHVLVFNLYPEVSSIILGLLSIIGNAFNLLLQNGFLN